MTGGFQNNLYSHLKGRTSFLKGLLELSSQISDFIEAIRSFFASPKILKTCSAHAKSTPRVFIS
jgi:hypothetical protein